MAEEKVRLAFDIISKEENGHKALEILNIVSYFAPENIHVGMFSSLVSNEKELGVIIKLLKQCSVINQNKESSFHVDKSVQKVIRSNLEKRNKKEVLKKALALLFELGINLSNLDHAISVWDYVSEYPELIKMSSGLPSHIVNLLSKHIRYEEANVFGWKALDLLKRTIGECHRETLTLQHNVGTLLGSEGKYKEALEILLPLFEKDLELSKQSEMRDSLTTIARQLCELSRYSEAETIYHKLLDDHQVSETSDGTTLTAWHDYALLLSDLGQNQKSLKIFREVLLRNEVLGADSDDILATKSSIAHVLIKQFKFSEALKILNEVFNERKAISGKDHPDTLRTRRDMGLVLQNQEEYEKALVIYEEVSNKFKEVLGDEHPDTLATQANLASILHIKKEYQKALEIYQYVYKKQSETLGQQHIETLEVKHNMASIFLVQRKYDEVLKVLQEVYEGFNKILGSDHQNTLGTRSEIELLLKLANQLSIAVKRNDFKETENLIKHGVVVNNGDNDGCTPLHHAVNNGNISIVRILLLNGADATLITNKGNTPLHIAVLGDYKEIVEVLLQHVRSDKLSNFINAGTTATGTTSLHVAAKNGSLTIVKSLLSKGAIYNVNNREDKTPFDLSKNEKVTNLLKLLEELFENARNGNLEIIRKLKAMKPDEIAAATNARNNQGNTILQVVISNKHMNIASEMLEILKRSD